MKFHKVMMFGVFALCATAAVQPVHATTVYDQPVNYDNAWNSTSGQHQAYDNFTLAAGASITGATWSGVFADPGHTFTISFYQDNAGLPGTEIASYAVGAANETDSGVMTNFSFELYDYSASFAPVALAAGTEYWFSVLDTSSNKNDNWYWEQGTGGDGQSHQVGSGPVHSDLNFSLTSDVTAIPEPSSLALLGTGLLGAFGAARRRFVKA